MASRSEVRYAIGLGVSILGFVSRMPSPGAAEDAEIRAMASVVPPGVETFLLTTANRSDEIVSHFRRAPTTALQLVRPVPIDDLKRLREDLPGTRLVQVIYVTDEVSIGEAARVAPYVDAIHLDSTHPHPTRPQVGGTGLTHDWAISRRIVDSIRTPVILAGGLRASNVRDAVEAVQPYAVDVCTGVRDERYLLVRSDLAAFMNTALSVTTKAPRSLAD